MGTKQASGSHQVESTEGHPKYPVALVEEHASQPITKQAELIQQALRSLTYVMVERCKKYALSLSKSDATKFHSLMQSMGIAYDRAYKGDVHTGRGPQHVLIQLFGASGAGTTIARNLTAMIPQLHQTDGRGAPEQHQNDVIDVTPS